jgi:hypothetical protein
MGLLEGTGLVGPHALPSAPAADTAPEPVPSGQPAPTAPPATSLFPSGAGAARLTHDGTHSS